MNVALSTSSLLLALAAGLAAQEPSRASSRRPVDLSLAGLDGALGPPSMGAIARLFCAPRVEDQATGGCLTASSIASSGMLFPYPGVENTFEGPAFVGGGESNQALGQWSAVVGGRANEAGGQSTAVGGGEFNDAAGGVATVGGGYNNTVSGRFAVVAGGGGYVYGNNAAGDFSAIGGGRQNDVSAAYATVAGGRINEASGEYAMIPGGHRNAAQGDYSFAAGRRARANHTGAFVWADSLNLFGKSSSTENEFNVYCSGGARLFTDSGATTGVLLAPGAGSWTSVSDRDAKENLEAVDARDVLERVCALPLATWNYKEQSASIRHMGPMAQDFFAAFGLGLGDETIDTIDPDGVALAAIQGLNALVREKDAEITELRERLERLERAFLEEPLRAQH